MKELNINLGRDHKESVLVSAPPHDPSMSYPTFYYDGDKHLDLPGAEGTMLIRYRKIAKSENEDSDGDKHYSCTIQVKEIISAESDEAPERDSKRSEKAIDKLLEEKVRARKSSESEDDEY